MIQTPQQNQLTNELGCCFSSIEDVRKLVEQLALEENTSQEEQQLLQELIELYEDNKRIENNPPHNHNHHQQPNNFFEEEKGFLEEERGPELDCPVCLTNLLDQDAFFFQNCKHMFHRECLEPYVINKIKERSFPIRCPDLQCKAELLEGEIKDIIQTDLRYQDVYDENWIKTYVESHPDEYCQCPTPNCDFVCENIGRRFNCPKCKKSYCLVCKTEWHFKMKCEEFQKQKKMQGDEYFKEFIKLMKYKKCPKCKTIIERSEGCNAMQCTRCKTNFCYACGREGDGHKCNHV